jgi:DNA-directed RNA polymerase specialized sigma subunit
LKTHTQKLNPWLLLNQKTLRNTGIDKSAQAGNSRSEDKLILIYASYVNFMVRQYSKKTEIKEDDDLRSYVNQGLLDGIRKFDPKRGSKFIYFAHIWMKKNILERRHTGLLGYRLIKKYSTTRMSKNVQQSS